MSAPQQVMLTHATTPAPPAANQTIVWTPQGPVIYAGAASTQAIVNGVIVGT